MPGRRRRDPMPRCGRPAKGHRKRTVAYDAGNRSARGRGKGVLIVGRRVGLWLRLRKELLGPSDIGEHLRTNDSPRDLYMTGVLAPVDADELDVPAAELVEAAAPEAPSDADEE